MFFKEGVRVKLVSKRLTIKGVVISHDDDSDTQIGNIEEYLKIKADNGTVYMFQGNGSLRPRAKSLRKYGHFYAVQDMEASATDNQQSIPASPSGNA